MIILLFLDVLFWIVLAMLGKVRWLTAGLVIAAHVLIGLLFFPEDL